MANPLNGVNWVILILDLIILLTLIGFLILFLKDNPADDFDIYTVHRNANFSYSIEPSIRIPRSLIIILLIIVFVFALFFDCYKLFNNRYQQDVANRTNAIKWVEFAFNATIILFIICVISGTNVDDTILLILAANLTINILSCCLDTYMINSSWYWIIIIGQTILGIIAYTILFTNLDDLIYHNRRNEVETPRAAILAVAVVSLFISLIGTAQYIAAYFQLNSIGYEIFFTIYTFIIRALMVLVIFVLFNQL